MPAEMFAQLDDAAVTQALERITSKELRKAVLRGADVTGRLFIFKVKRMVDREEPTWATKRRRGLLKDYVRWAKRMKGRLSGDTVISKVGTSTRYALPIEQGGTYEQFVTEYTQRRWGRGRMRDVRVKSHTRRHTEKRGRQYAHRAFGDVVPVAAEPTYRALYALITEGKVPTQATLRKGL